MSKLLTAYGNTMMSIGIWFIKRGENHAQWYTAEQVEQYVKGRK